MKILECSSKGDKRFSSFYAVVAFNGITDTIENHYQKCKRNIAGHMAGKGHNVAYVLIAGKQYEPAILTPFYRYLWFKYLKNNKELVEHARQFDDFNDMFKGKCVNCQADCIKAYVNKDKEFYNCIKFFLKNFGL